MPLRALIWDVDGTVAETERDGHRVAFNQAFQAFGLPWRWDVAHYGELLRVAGGYERLLFDMQARADAPGPLAERSRLARALHQCKNRLYADLVAGGAIRARPGVHRLMHECLALGLAQAVATTTSRANVEALFTRLFGGQWRKGFGAVVCAEDAPEKKPHPQAYLLALGQLGITAADALALEDSPNGLMAASVAGVPTLVTPSEYFGGASFDGCAGLCDDLEGPLNWRGASAPRVDVSSLRRLHAAGMSA